MLSRSPPGSPPTLLAIPALRSVLVGISAVYLVWLAYNIATAPPLGDRRAAAPSLRGGTLLGVANPKAWVAIGAVFASAHLASDAAADAVAKVAVLIGMIVVINGTWLLVGASLAPLLRKPRPARIVNVALAVALIAATALALVH